jgi:hypothetical protein
MIVAEDARSGQTVSGACAPMLLLQPVIQYYANVGGGTGRAVVFGFRTKVEF